MGLRLGRCTTPCKAQYRCGLLAEPNAADLTGTVLGPVQNFAANHGPEPNNVLTRVVAVDCNANAATSEFNGERVEAVRCEQARDWRAGRYLWHPHLPEEDPGPARPFYTQLSQVEEAFKNLKGDLPWGRFIINWSTGLRRTSS